MTAQTRTLVRIFQTGTAALLASCGGSYGGGDGNQPATLTLSVSPTTITLGESATLTWNSNAPNCTASGAWNGPKPGDGSEDVTPDSTGTFNYALVCSGGRYGESDQASATLTVNPARQATAWVGEACCLGSETFRVDGITSASGEIRFLARGQHVVGRPGGGVAAYGADGASLAGLRVAERPAFELRRVVQRETSGPVDRLEGVFTTQLASGYALTLSVDAEGNMHGADSRGCGFSGRATARAPDSPVHGVALTVSGCGDWNGGYAGELALLPNVGGESGGLLLSASNSEAAIGWRLNR